MPYLYTKVTPQTAATASTPQAWTDNFNNTPKMTRLATWRFRFSREWALIQRFVPRGGTIADMGSGPGWWVHFLSRHGYNAVGVDYAPDLIRRATEAYPESTWIEARIQEVPMKSGTLDAIISWGVIEHDHAGPSAALEEFHRLVRPGGHIIVTVPIDSPAARLAHVLFESGEGHRTFFQYLMSEGELREYVQCANFEILESGTLPSAHLNHVSPRLAQRLSGIAYKFASLFAWALFSWMDRYRVMVYVVARRRTSEGRG